MQYVIFDLERDTTIGILNMSILNILSLYILLNGKVFTVSALM